MGLKNTKDSYGLISKAFHWLTALIILALIVVGLYMGSIPYGPFKLEIYALHKSFGILVLWLVGLRIIWKLLTTKPEAHPNHQWWERALAKITHLFLYVAMFSMPLSGWLMSSAGEYPVPFFGFQMPDLVGKDKDLAGLMHQVHEILAYILIGAVVLHAIGALKHHFIDKDSTLIRMMAKPMQKIGPYLIILILTIFSIAVLVFFLKGQQPKAQEDTVNNVVIEESAVSTSDSQWIIIKDQSNLNFKASVYGKEFTGEFKDFSGEITFDPENLATNRVDITINIRSVNTDDEERDNSIITEEWFHIDEYPEASFTADSFSKQSDGQFIANGQLTIKGNTVPIKLPFTLEIDEKSDDSRVAVMKGQITLDRLDFGLGAGRWESGDSVGLSVLVDINVMAETSP